MKIRLLERLANLSPYLVLSAYIAGVIFCILNNKAGYLINGSIIAIPAIVGAATFIFIKKSDPDLSGKVPLFSHNPSSSTMAFVLFYILTTLTLLVTPGGSKLPLVAIILLYIIIFIQIMSRRLLPAVILLEIVLTLAATIYSYTLRSALYFGATDTMPHIYHATVTYLSGHIIPLAIATYAYFPLYHIFVAESANVLGLDVQTSLFITTGLIFSLTVLFLYHFINSVFRNEQISLLIALVYAMNSSVISYGTYMVTRTMAYVGFLILLYLLYLQASSRVDAKHLPARSTAPKALTVITALFILLTHQVSTPMIVILLGFLLYLEMFVRERRRVSLALLLVPISLCATYWTFVAYPFFKELLPRTEPTLYKNVVFAPVVYQGLSFLTNQLDTLVVVFFALMGGIYLQWKQKPRYAAVFAIFGLIAVPLSVPNVLTMVFQLVTLLQIERFALLLLPFLAIVMGAGIYIFARHLSIAKVAPGWIGLLLIAMITLYGIGSLGLVEQEPDHKRYSFDQVEIVGYNHVLETVPSGSNLYSDYYTTRFFTRPDFADAESLGLSSYITYEMQSALDVSEKSGYIVHPNDQFHHGGLLFEKGDELDPENYQPYLPTEENVTHLSQHLSRGDKIYSNYDVDVYRFL